MANGFNVQLGKWGIQLPNRMATYLQKMKDQGKKTNRSA